MAKVTLTMTQLVKGWAWRLDVWDDDGKVVRSNYGSQRTKVAQSVSQDSMQEALHATIRSMVLEGSLPWLPF